MRSVSSHVLPTVALRSELKSSNSIIQPTASGCTELNCVVGVVVGKVRKSPDVVGIVGPTALVSHVARVDGSIHIRCAIEARIRIWVVPCLASGIADIVCLGAIAIEIIEEETSHTSLRREHGTSIMIGIDVVNSVTLTSRGRAYRRECFDKVEEPLIAISAGGIRSTTGGVIP